MYEPLQKANSVQQILSDHVHFDDSCLYFWVNKVYFFNDILNDCCMAFLFDKIRSHLSKFELPNVSSHHIETLIEAFVVTTPSLLDVDSFGEVVTNLLVQI